MLDRNNLHNKILDTAAKEFAAKGIRAVRMDDIASKLGISKRTLYETFPNKEDILLECIRTKSKRDEEEMARFYSEPNHNVIDVILKYYKDTMEHSSEFNSCYFEEIKRYKKVVDFFEERKYRHRNSVKIFMEKGVKDGFFRADIDYEVMAAVSDNMMENIITKQLYSHWNISHLFHNIFFMFFRGICTPKGLKLIDTWTGDYHEPQESMISEQ